MREGDPIRARHGAHPVLWAMAAVMAGFELIFAGAEAGLLPQALGRLPAYVGLAFWDILFERARAGEGVSPELVWSFLTHALLHGGWLHLALNGAAFLGLGNALVRAIGPARFLAVFAVTAVAGALLFGLLAQTQGPLVGASGALFGFLGMITAWQERALRRMGLSRAPVWKRIAGLVALNVILELGLGGLLAWEAHLGGWIAGWLMAYGFPPRGPAFRIL
jgi:membrane associated rhomboid family serine protease